MSPVISGETLTLEAVSPSTVILSPPEKLVLEVRTFGRYNFIQWIRNGNVAGLSGFPAMTGVNYAHFTEIYVNDSTSMTDLGVYEVEMNTFPGQVRPDVVTFILIAPGIE